MNVLIKQLSKDKIFHFLQKVDSCFIPFPLSKRVNLKLYSEKLADCAIHFLIEFDNQLIGMCCCYMNDPKIERVFLSIICLNPDYHRMGLGKILLHECELYANKNGFIFIELEVNVENSPAIEMYKVMGYSIDRQEKESFFMKKLL